MGSERGILIEADSGPLLAILCDRAKFTLEWPMTSRYNISLFGQKNAIVLFTRIQNQTVL